jgi:uncharacterized membrane protein YphA (DoxX/SURF4 family)
MTSSKVRVVVSWVLAVLLAGLFVVASLGKLTGEAREMFAAWGYAAWFATLIGVLELCGGIGLLIPRLSQYAAVGLAGIMLGAAYTHLANGEGLRVLIPLGFLVVLAILWWLRRRPSPSVVGSTD